MKAPVYWLLGMILVVGWVVVPTPPAAEAVCAAVPHKRGVTIGPFNQRRAANASGWWTRGSCDQVNLADVWVKLQMKKSVAHNWHLQDYAECHHCPPGDTWRAWAHAYCFNSDPSLWRAIIDVDLVGYADSPNKVYTAAEWKPCENPY